MTRREQGFGLAGGAFGVLIACAAIRVSNTAFPPAARADVAALATAVDAGADPDTEAGIDPAMVANANLAESLHECSQALARFTGDKTRLEQQIGAERSAEADASRAAQARRIARRDVSPNDWKQLASAGTIRYVIPCASFNPPPDMLDRMGIAARDVPTIRSAFVAARDAAWTQIRTLCATAVGSTAAADKLGLDACPQLILDAEKTANPADADAAMRAVGAVRAGLADPSSIPAGDPVGAAFLVLTGVAKDAEGRLGADLGPEDARTAVYGNGNCSRTSEFASPRSDADR